MNFKTIIFKLKTAYGNLFLTIKLDTVTLSTFLFLGQFF